MTEPKLSRFKVHKAAIADTLAKKKKKSVNGINVDHIKIACRHVEELMEAGVTENLAIRTLELFVDVFGKIEMGGSATPHHVRQFKHWSKAALKLKSPETLMNARAYFRVEHGTPRRQLARKVMALARRRTLTDAALAKLIQKHWKLAVITLAEDDRLNKFARSTMFNSPDERWAAAGIKF